MFPEVSLPFTPTVANCMTWSLDGELAIAAGEYVHILIPCRRQLHAQPARDAWTHVHIRVNLFTFDEWPERTQLSNSDFTIGEEQSLSTVTALGWSSPGLAKHRRPVLAVLTSNHLLSIWASNSDMRVPLSWKRMFVINNAVHQSLNPLSPNAASETRSVKPTEHRTLRVRCMAWAPLLEMNDAKAVRGGQVIEPMNLNEYQPETDHLNGTLKAAESLPAEIALTPEVQLLAMANNCGDIYVLRINSPYTHHSNAWGADVIQQCLIPKPSKVFSLMPEKYRNEDYVSTTSFQVEHSGNQVMSRPSLFADAMAKKVYIEEVLWSTWRADQSGSAYAGTLTTKRDSVIYQSTFFIKFTDSIIQCRCEDPKASVLDLVKPSPSSSVWCQLDEDECPIFANACQDRVEFSIKDLDTLRHLSTEWPAWSKTSGQLREEQYAVTETPWDPIYGIAYCNSLDDDTLTLYLSTHLSSTAAISLKDCKDRRRKNQITANTINDRALKRKLQQLHHDHDRQENLGGLSVMKTWGLASMPDNGLISSCISFHPGDMPEYVTPSLEKSMVIFASDTSEDRLETFPWLEVPVVWDVITTQRTIIDAISDYSNVTNCKRSLFSDRIRAAALAAEKHLTHMDGDEKMEALEENCAICNERIPFEGLTEASCGQGHECTRCSLTFLAITRPGISKRCEGCRREFLNEPDDADGESTSSTAPSTGVDGEPVVPQPSLTCWLFRKFDVCPYCCGKFVG